MARFEFTFGTMACGDGETYMWSPTGLLKQSINIELFDLNFQEDDRLYVSHQQHHDLATRIFSNHSWFGRVGLIRYVPGALLIPRSTILPVYESPTSTVETNPKRFVYIHRMVVCHAFDLEPDEIRMVGFRNLDDVRNKMRQRYPDFSLGSVVSFYALNQDPWQH